MILCEYLVLVLTELFKSTSKNDFYERDDTGVTYTPPPLLGWYTPIDVNTHTQTVLPPLGVCTVQVVYSYTAYDFRH